jgi:hypothetical protein
MNWQKRQSNSFALAFFDDVRKRGQASMALMLEHFFLQRRGAQRQRSRDIWFVNL